MAYLHKELEDLDDLDFVQKIEFGLMNPELIRKGSVVEVTSNNTYEGTVPKVKGLLDPRMGVLEGGKICPIDKNTSHVCPGYFGHIELAMPVFKLSYLQWIRKTLSCVCFRCSNILINKNDTSLMKNLKGKSNKERFEYIYEKSSKIKVCEHNDGCFYTQPKYSVSIDKNDDYIIKIYATFPDKVFKEDEDINPQQILNAQQCQNILKRIKDDDSLLLGFNPKYSRPEWMIISTLPVPPIPVRPSVSTDSNQRRDDDLTYVLNMIVKINNTLKDKLESDAVDSKIGGIYNSLQTNVATYFDNTNNKLPVNCQRSRKPLKSLIERLKSKEGRIRGNLMGKRVDFSARTVISGDPNLDIDQYGMPLKIAMNLTVPVKVTKFNKKEVAKLVKNGPNIYPGAKSIQKMRRDCDGNVLPCRILLKHVNYEEAAEKLVEGDIVHRHVLDNDIALFNRQPSLHRMSMMAHRIKVVKNKTFRLNVNVTTPYNADFDGDEMNCHLPQSIETSYELKSLAFVPTQIISPAKSKPIISIVQDTLVGSYLITQPDLLIPQKLVYNILMKSKNFVGKLPKPVKVEEGINYYTGQQIISEILPNISLRMTNQQDKIVSIKNGVFEEGILDKKILGATAGGLIHHTYNMKGITGAKNLIDNIEKMITRWVISNGFSLGIGDATPSYKMMEDTHVLIDQELDKAYKVMVQAQHGVFEPNLSTEYRRDSFEKTLNSICTQTGESVKKLLMKHIKEHNPTNAIYTTITSGSKGKGTNIQQIMGSVGQQAIRGQRVAFGFTDRTLPHFHKFDYGPQAKGFVRNSFISGLTPDEVFFHAMGGREGIIDTAIKTAESGYIQRRLVKAMEDMNVAYDNTVRSAKNNVVQFIYGEDGFDPTTLVQQKVLLISFDNHKMREEFSSANLKKADWLKFMDKKTYDELKETKDWDKTLEKEYEWLMDSRSKLRNEYSQDMSLVVCDVLSPINFHRLIPATRFEMGIKKYNKSDLNPLYTLKRIEEVEEILYKYNRTVNALPLFRILMRSNLNWKQCCMKHRLSKEAFDKIIETLKVKIISSYITPGDGVGPVAATSIGEGGTQGTLNTFHLAGVAGKSIVTTEGIARLDEILKLTRKMKTPSCRIFLKKEYAKYRENAMKLKNMFEHTTFRDIIKSSEIRYEYSGTEIEDDEEMEFISVYNMFDEILKTDNFEEESLSNWILRFEFDREALMKKNIYMSQIQERILENVNDDIQTIISDDNSGNLVLRMRIKTTDEDTDYLEFLQTIEKSIVDKQLRGIDGINQVEPEAIKVIEYYEDGSFESIQNWVLNSQGSNLLDILNNDLVDSTLTTSNDIREIYEIFGVEAARTKIIEELRKNIDGGKDMYRHFTVLADTMTGLGGLMSIDRHGVNRDHLSDNSVLSKASFEEVPNIITKAAIFAEVDDMKGVSGNIMMGQPVKYGTNAFEVLFDEEKFAENFEETKEEESKEDDDGMPNMFELADEIDKLTVDNLMDEEDFDFSNDVGTAVSKPLPKKQSARKKLKVNANKKNTNKKNTNKKNTKPRKIKLKIKKKKE